MKVKYNHPGLVYLADCANGELCTYEDRENVYIISESGDKLGNVDAILVNLSTGEIERTDPGDQVIRVEGELLCQDQREKLK